MDETVYVGIVAIHKRHQNLDVKCENKTNKKTEYIYEYTVQYKYIYIYIKKLIVLTFLCWTFLECEVVLGLPSFVDLISCALCNSKETLDAVHRSATGEL